MKMKRFIVTTISVVFVLTLMLNNHVQAQKKHVRKAQIWAESGEKLDTALKATEFAETQEKTKDWAKTYYVKALVYNAISSSENPEFQNICENPLIKAFDNYKKAYNMDGGGAYKNAIDIKLITLANNFIQKAIDTYNENDYENSFLYFAKSVELKEMSVFGGEIDTAILFNTAIAAQRVEKYDEALKYYEKLIEYEYGAGDTYLLYAGCYKAKGDKENYLKLLKAGFEKYPGNFDVIGGIINYYLLEDENTEGAFEYINLAKEKDPDNPQYFSAEAHLYNKIGELDKAKEKYKQAIEIDPELFDAQYNLGVIYFNEAVELSDEANAISDNTEYQVAKEKADAKFLEALPYIEYAYKLTPEDIGIMSTLKTLYYRLGMTEKYEEISKKME
ncbi:MAG: tetratricopeptide repeat protein [Bacteroidales bacterium]|jgi:tetratricopeptide (TPR) repeat protein|nr:tetratricopeptide repeat protein [Bacteroidales bacterium]